MTALTASNDPDLNVRRGRGHQILLMDALEDGETLPQHQSQAFKLLLDQAGIHSQLVMAPGTHGWSYVGRQMPAVLGFLASGWASRAEPRLLRGPIGPSGRAPALLD